MTDALDMHQVLTGAQVQQFHAAGFTWTAALIDQPTVDELRQAYDEIIRGDVDCGGYDRSLGGVTRQVMQPHLYHPTIRDSQVLSRAQALASELLEGPAELTFDMMIFKPPGHPATTPWHQDLAYAGRPFAPAGTPARDGKVQVWVALDDAEVANGCMQFLPGFHRQPLLEHHVVSGDVDDDGRLLAFTDGAIRQLDLSAAVACPLPRGGATAHGECTPHFTGPNTTDRDRRAYILNFGRASG